MDLSTDNLDLNALLGQGMDLVYNWQSRPSRVNNPPAVPATPAPTTPTRSVYYPAGAAQANGETIAQQLADIMSSPRTWLAVGGVVLLVFLVRRR